jgi:hypothetical protein
VACLKPGQGPPLGLGGLAVKRVKHLDVLDGNGVTYVGTITRGEFDRLRDEVPQVHVVQHEQHAGLWD